MNITLPTPQTKEQTLLLQFIKSVSIMNKRTANEYYDRLVNSKDLFYLNMVIIILLINSSNR